MDRDPGTGFLNTPWAPLRAAGAGWWLSRDAAAARAAADALAKAQFAARRDPTDAALLYVAMGRAPLLATLLKNGGDARLAGFFGRRDFGADTGRGAALKNAYAAKAARRFGLAAACFLLAGCADDAVAVCASEAGDPQLAALVAAVAGGGTATAASARADAAVRAGADRAPWRAAALRAAAGDAQGALDALLWLVEGVGEGDGAAPPPAASLPLLPALVRAGAAPPTAASFAALASIAATAAASTAPLLAAEAAEAAVAAAGGAETAVAVAGAAVAAADAATQAVVRASLPTVANAAASALAQTQAASAAAHSAAAAAAAAAADADAALRSAARPALAARRARAPAPRAPPPGLPFGPPTTLIRLPGDRLHAIASAAGGAVDAPRAVAVATAGRGVVWLEWAEADAAADGTPDAAGLSPRRRRSLSDAAFTAALGEALDSYEGDGWGGVQVGEHAAAPPPHSLPRVAAAASDLAGCVALGAHPFRPLLLAGAPGGEVLLFQFGRRAALAAYTPLTPADGAGADSAAADASLFAAPAAAWHADATSAAAAWGVPQAAAFSRCGERAAALGALGGLALWSLDAPRSAGSPTGALGRAAWAARGLASRGATLAWIGASSSLVAVGGADAAGSVALWDARAPPDAGPSARAAAGGGPLVTSLASLPGGRALVVGDETGGLAAVDLRALGGGRCTTRAVAWRAERGGGSGGSGGGTPASSDPGVTCAAAGVAGAHGAVVVVGDRGGGVRVLSGGDGALLQRLGPEQRSGAATPPSGVSGWLAGLVGASARSTTTAAPITGVTLCADGVAACSLDGVVRAWREA